MAGGGGEEDESLRALEEAAGFKHLTDNEWVDVKRPERKHPRDPSYDCGCKAREKGGKGDICCSSSCLNWASHTECIVGSCSKRRCRNKRIQRKEYADVEVFDVRGDRGLGRPGRDAA